MAAKVVAWRFTMLALVAWWGAWRRLDGRRHADGAMCPAMQLMRHSGTPCARHLGPCVVAAMANLHNDHHARSRCGARMAVAWRQICHGSRHTGLDVARAWRWRGGRHSKFAVAPRVALDVALCYVIYI